MLQPIPDSQIHLPINSRVNAKVLQTNGKRIQQIANLEEDYSNDETAKSTVPSALPCNTIEVCF
jgi:hypothetical protein